jgi:hypothetical protein
VGAMTAVTAVTVQAFVTRPGGAWATMSAEIAATTAVASPSLSPWQL